MTTTTLTEPQHSTGFFHWILRQRIFVIFMTIVITFGFGAGMEKLQFSSDYRDFFEETNPKLIAFEALQNKFVRTNNVFLAIESTENNLFTANGLHTLIELTDRLWALPHVVRVDSITNHQFITSHQDDILVSDLKNDQGEINDGYATKFHHKSLQEKGLRGLLVTEDPSLTGINVLLADSGATELGKKEFMLALDTLLNEFSDRKLTSYKTGSIAIDRSFDVAAEADVETLYGIVYLLVLILAGLLTRSAAAVIGILISITFSWFIALGLAGWLDIKLTAVSVSAPMVLMTLAVAQSIHIIFSIQKNRSQNILVKEAVEKALKSNIKPLSLVSLSTAIGFFSITSSEVPPLQDLGFMLTVGAIAIYILTLTFLPAFLSLFTLKASNQRQWAEQLMEKFGYFVAKHSLAFLFLGGVVAVVMLYPVTKNEINDNFVEYFDSNISIRTDSEYINQHLTGIHQLYFELEATGKTEIFEPEFLNYLDKLVIWLNLQPEISHVSSLADVLKRLNRASHPDDASRAEAYKLPVSKALASQLYLMYEISLPYGITTSNLVDINQQSTLLTIALNNLSSAEILALEQRIHEWHKQYNISNKVTLHPGTGPAIMFADIGQRNAKSLVISTLQALFFVSIILLVALRSLKLSLISMIPNLLPALLAFGVWGIIDGEIGLAISIVAIMTFGIVVDDTIYFLTRFKENLTKESFEQCIAETFKQVGMPIICTTIILTCGFLVLVFSNFRLNQGMGLLTAMVISLALVCDLFLLPGLMKLFAYKRLSSAQQKQDINV